MLHYPLVAQQILRDPLYNTLLFEMQESLQQKALSVLQVEACLCQSPEFVQEYKEINRFSELSNIQARDLALSELDSPAAASLKRQINANLQRLRELENFEMDATGSAYGIWLGSVGIMVVFMLHNVFALFTELYKSHGLWIYSLYGLVVLATWWGVKRMKDRHQRQHLVFGQLYQETLQALEQGVQAGYFSWAEVYPS